MGSRWIMGVQLCGSGFIHFVLSSLSLYIEPGRITVDRMYIIYIRTLFISTPQSISSV